MGKLAIILYFILSVFPADAFKTEGIYTLSGEGERILTEAIMSPRYGSRRKERRKTVLKVIDDNWEEFNKMIDDIFAGKKIKIKKIK